MSSEKSFLKLRKEMPFIKRSIHVIIHSRIRALRFIVQLTVFLLVNGAIFGLKRTWIPVPFVQPTGAPYSTVWGGFEALQYLLAAGEFPFIIIALFVLVGTLMGRTFCGWACPFGFMQDLVAMLPIPKYKVSKRTNKESQNISVFILWTFVAMAVIIGINEFLGQSIKDAVGPFADMPYSVFDPAGTWFVTLYYIAAWNAWPKIEDPFQIFTFWGQYSVLFWIRIFFFLIVFVLMLFIPRAYCRYFCPTGAILSYFSPYGLPMISRNLPLCDECGDCVTVCPMGVPILDYTDGKVRDSMCIQCMDCVDVCHSSALSLKLNI